MARPGSRETHDAAAWPRRQGTRRYLDASYGTAAADDFDSVLHEFIAVHASGAVSLLNVCQVAGLGWGRDGSCRYYMSEPVIRKDRKGVGPFIMAGIGVSKMLSNHND